MSFDWRSFATGFLERQTEITDERREEAKTFEKEQRDAAERNAQVISRRRAIADRVTGYATYLQSNGVSEEQLQAVISSGPEAIATLTERVQAAVEANNGRPLGSSDVAAIINVPEGFSPLEMSMDEFIRQTYGLGAPTPAVPEEELTMLQRISGMGEMERARERLSRTNMAEDMTILQINEAARRADYESLMPGTFASVSGVGNIYSPIDDGTVFTTNSLQLLTRLEDSQAWLSTEGDPDRQQVLMQQTLNSSIRGYADKFGASFLQDQETFIRNNLGDEYTDALLADYGLGETEAPEPGETTITPPAETPPPAGSGETQSSQVTTEVSTTNEEPTAAVEPVELVEPAVIPVAPRSESATLSVGDEATPEPPLNATVNVEGLPGEEAKAFTYQQWLDMSRRERREAGLPINRNRANAYFTEYGVDPETGTSFVIEDIDPETEVETDTGETVTYQQWLDMSRTERRNAGLPESFVGGQIYFKRFGVGLNTVDPETGQGIFEQTPESAQAQQSEAYRALSAQGVDDISINLLETRGRDMARYLRAQGVTDPEAAFNALTEWGQQNNIVMPFDKSALIFALMQDINR